MPRLPDAEFRHLVADLRDRVASAAPGWTDQNVYDPGIAVLELVAYLLEELGARPAALDRLASLRRLYLALDRLAPSPPGVLSSSLVRTHFFSGRLLGAADFEREQNYVRERDRRLALALAGSGVVRGLRVLGDGAAVTVTPGIAIDPNGEILVVDCAHTVPVAIALPEASVIVRHVERAAEPLQSLEGLVHGVVIEEAEVAVVQTPDPNDVVLARVRRDGGAYRIVVPGSAS